MTKWIKIEIRFLPHMNTDLMPDVGSKGIGIIIDNHKCIMKSNRPTRGNHQSLGSTLILFSGQQIIKNHCIPRCILLTSLMQSLPWRLDRDWEFWVGFSWLGYGVCHWSLSRIILSLGGVCWVLVCVCCVLTSQLSTSGNVSSSAGHQCPVYNTTHNTSNQNKAHPCTIQLL